MHYPPMLLTPATELPVGPEWTYEPKLDGYRMIGEVAAGGAVTLTSRQGNDFTGRYPIVAQELPVAFGGEQVVMDGEIVGFNPAGQPDFNVLRRKNPHVEFYVFDLLEVNGLSIINLPLAERRHWLRELFAPPVAQPHVRLVDCYDDRDLVLAAVASMGWEGVVVKRTDSTYQPGVRSRDWLKKILNPHPSWRH
jgi:bifunctional non-homologous end joining protein LigD